MEKLCVFCIHHEWERPYDASGCPTFGPILDGGFSCKKKHYTESLPYSEDDYRKLLLTAETCKDYTPPNAKLSGPL